MEDFQVVEKVSEINVQVKQAGEICDARAEATAPVTVETATSAMAVLLRILGAEIGREKTLDVISWCVERLDDILDPEEEERKEEHDRDDPEKGTGDPGAV